MDEKPDDKNAELEGETLEAFGQPTGGQVISPQAADENPSEGSEPPVADKFPEPEKTTSKAGSWFSRLRSSKNFYLFIFVGLVVMAAIMVFAAFRWGGSNPSGKGGKSQTLTNDQLADLAGNTTLVGDSKQTLNIASNTVFEGQVLARGDLNVAGALKVGGLLSLPSVSAGDGTFTKIQINDTLAVAGGTTLQGQLTVQSNLTVAGSASFKNISASQLNVSSLQLTGDLAINRHIAPGGGVPSKTNGSALGGGGTASVSGADTAGTITVNTGSSPPAGCFITVNFVAKFNTTPRVLISPSNSSAASLNYYTNRSTANFSLCTVNAPTAGTNYFFDYIVFD